MFDRFTETARRVTFVARLEASRFGSPKIETEHLLLGLVREDAELLNRFLTSEISDAYIRQVLALAPVRESAPANEDMPFSDESRSALSLAAEEADALGQQNIGTEHLLLGLLRTQDSFAARLLRERGAEIEVIRKELAIAPQPLSRESRRRRLSKEVARLVLEQVPMTDEFRKENSATSHSGFPNPDEVLAALSGLKGYTEKARRAIFFAMYEASQFHSALIETEHLLLGALREGEAYLNLFLPDGASRETVRAQIEKGHTRPLDKVSISAGLPLSEECGHAQAYAEEEATMLGSEQIGSEHLLLGLLREEGCSAARILREHGAELQRVRKELATAPERPPSSSAGPDAEG